MNHILRKEGTSEANCNICQWRDVDRLCETRRMYLLTFDSIEGMSGYEEGMKVVCDEFTIVYNRPILKVNEDKTGFDIATEIAAPLPKKQNIYRELLMSVVTTGEEKEVQMSDDNTNNLRVTFTKLLKELKEKDQVHYAIASQFSIRRKDGITKICKWKGQVFDI